MSKLIAAWLVLCGCASTAPAWADVDPFAPSEGLRLAKRRPIESRAHALHTTAGVGDTTYIGYTPGRFDPAKNWWSIGAGHSPDNGNSPAFKRPYAGQGGMWDFDATGGSNLHGDSLQGWWPDRQIVTGTGGLTRPDWQRPWWAIENGNKANYVLPGASRTYGVVGVWHRDDAGPPSDGGPNGPTWTPIGGSYSAWMGLRRHGDLRFLDPITNNAFNSEVLAFTTYNATGASGTDNAFPGYGSQMDQLLYRDIDMSGHLGSALSITYSYRLRMSTAFGNSASTRTGWFDKDPLQVVNSGSLNIATGNFISSSDAGDANAPRDSFSVYVGAPVTTSFRASTGETQTVYDPMRRWFSEVIRANEPSLWKQIDRDTGSVALAAKTATISNSVLAPMLAASGGVVRVVFRVHTNRGFDDQSSTYSSGGAGAAVLDDVSWQIVGGPASPAGWGDFESPGSIDNRTIVTPQAAWKSTGKPPQPFAHAHSLFTMQYEDLCGQPGDNSRQCNLDGVVLSLGDHDHSEAAAGLVDGTVDRELWIGAWSPTIQLRSDQGSWPNPIGLQSPSPGGAGDPDADEDYWIDYELYAGVFDPFAKGVLWRFGFMSYPAADRNGRATWGNARVPPYIIFNPDQVCLRDVVDNPIRANGMLRWSPSLSENPDFPDSVRIMVGHRSECYRFGVSTGCAPTDGSYWDNISLDIVDGAPLPLSASIWDLFHDTFPANETAGLPSFAARFDTTAAYVKTGVNIAQTTGNVQRWTVPGDSAVVISGSGPQVRVDLVFRILPGPGNYATIGRPDLGTLRQVPNSSAPIAGPVLNSPNFWENYLANNGTHGTPGGHGTQWNANVWNSARCDTAESSVFPFMSRGILGGPVGTGEMWTTSYHESELGIVPAPENFDPYPVVTHRSALAVSRHRCYLASASASTSHIDCVHDAPGVGPGYDLSYLSAPGVGWDGSNTTVEGTKILPDGQFTPGAHVQYFFRKQTSGGLAGLMPDTNVVYPQPGEGSEDAHRWQQFGVLPDRWKDPGYRHPVFNTFGAGHACMLVVDQHDRRGDERVWVGVADTIGATLASKRGAHNGWFAPGTGTAAVNDPTNFVRTHGGQPGTTWDLYQVKASESLNTRAGSIGSRLSFRDPANTQIAGKTSRLGPTPEMLSVFYRLVMLFSGDLNTGILGPFINYSAGDVPILENWLAEGSLSALDVDRGLWAIGNGIVESSIFEGGDQELFLTDVLGVTLRSNSYTLESGNTELVPDLLPVPGGPLAPLGDTWGVRNPCVTSNDVLERTPSLLTQTSGSAKYEDFGPGPFPLLASVAKFHSASHPWISNVDGFDMSALRSRFDTDVKGRHRYFNQVANLVFAGICPIGTICVICGQGVDDVGHVHADFVELASNPVRSGHAIVRFGLARTDRVEACVFDVAGRMVRRLADRRFAAGEHRLMWDGLDERGNALPRGVYFTRIRYVERGFEGTRKLTFLR